MMISSKAIAYMYMELVEQLGSDIPRILQAYGRECFHFSENYTRMSFPVDKSVQVTEHDELNGGLNGGLKKVLLSVIEKTPGIQLKEILNLTSGNSQRTVERQIAQLINEEKIERRGSRKTGGYWIINHEKEPIKF